MARKGIMANARAAKYGTMGAWDRMSARQAKATYQRFVRLYDSKPSAWQPGDRGSIDRAVSASYDADIRGLARRQRPAENRVYRAALAGKRASARDVRVLSVEHGRTGQYIEVWDRRSGADWTYKQGTKARRRAANKTKWKRRKSRVLNAVRGSIGWDRNKHPRYPKGHPKGGKFMPKGGRG